MKSSSFSARAVSVESEFVPIDNDQNEGGNPTFRIGEKVAVGYLEVEGTTKVKAGELKWSKATIKSGPTMVTKKGKHVCYIITYHGSAQECTFFPITAPGKGGADRWQRGPEPTAKHGSEPGDKKAAGIKNHNYYHKTRRTLISPRRH